MLFLIVLHNNNCVLLLFLLISVRIDTGAPRFILLLRSVQEELSVTLSVKTSGNLRAIQADVVIGDKASVKMY